MTLTVRRSGFGNGFRSLGSGSKRHAIESLPATVIPGAASFIALAAVGHLAGGKVLGLLSLAWVTANFGSSIIGMGTSHVAVRSVATGHEHLVAGLRGTLLRRCAIALPAVFAAGFVLDRLGAGPGVAIMVAAPWMAGQAVVLFESEVLRAEQRFSAASALLSGRAVGGWAGTLAGVAASHTLLAAVLPHVAVSLGVAAALLAVRRPARLRMAHRSEIDGLSRPIAQLSVASYALGYADRYVVNAVAGPVPVGIYTLGYTLGQGLVELVMAPVTTALLPRLVAEWNDVEKGRAVALATARRAGAAIMAASLVSVPVLLGADQLGMLEWISPSGELAPIAVLVALAMGAHGVTRLCYALLLADRRPSEANRAFWQVVGLSAAVVPVMTAVWGAVGAAGATLVAYTVLACRMFTAVHRKIRR